MKAEGPCLDCGRWVVFFGRQRCRRCNQRARRNTPPAPCPRCGTIGMVWPEVNCCGQCSFLEWRRTSVDRTRDCVACGEVKWISCHGMCSACRQRDPDWPYRYAANLAARLGGRPPKWLDAYVDHLAERFAPSVTMDHLRKLRVALESTGTSTPSRSPLACLRASIDWCSASSAQRRASASPWTRRPSRLNAGADQGSTPARRHGEEPLRGSRLRWSPARSAPDASAPEPMTTARSRPACRFCGTLRSSSKRTARL